MKRPAWQGPAEAVYGMLLNFYPRSVRERHGEDMRQAFRDRCREVFEGRTSAWRLFCLEMAPDFATSVGGAHLGAPGTPRMRASLLALAVLGGIWFFQDSLSPRLLDGYFSWNLRWQHWREERAFARDEARVRSLAEPLAASSRELDRGLSAYLYAINFTGRRYATTYALGAATSLPFELVTEDGARAKGVLATIAKTTDVATARVALAACLAETGCDRLTRAKALVELEPRNAYGWAQLLKLHMGAGDEAAVATDLRNVGMAAYYEDEMAGARRALLAASMRADAVDAATVAALGRQLIGAEAMATDDFGNSLFVLCRLQWEGPPSPPTWLLRHPEARQDCRRAASLLAQSGSGWQALWGWHWQDRDESTPRTRAGVIAAGAKMEAQRNVGIVHLGERRWRPWTDAEWLAWARSQKDAS